MAKKMTNKNEFSKRSLKASTNIVELPDEAPAEEILGTAVPYDATFEALTLPQEDADAISTARTAADILLEPRMRRTPQCPGSFEGRPAKASVRSGYGGASPTYYTTTTASTLLSTPKSPKYKEQGDLSKDLNVPGLYVSVELDGAGEPVGCILIEVEESLQGFKYIGKNVDGRRRIIDELDPDGIYIYVCG